MEAGRNRADGGVTQFANCEAVAGAWVASQAGAPLEASSRGMAYERASPYSRQPRIRANGHLETIERRPGWEWVRWQGQSGISSVLSVRAPCPLAAVA